MRWWWSSSFIHGGISAPSENELVSKLAIKIEFLTLTACERTYDALNVALNVAYKINSSKWLHYRRKELLMKKSSYWNHSSYKHWGNKQTSWRESVLTDWVFSWTWSSAGLTRSSLNWNRIKKNRIFSKPKSNFVWLSFQWFDCFRKLCATVSTFLTMEKINKYLEHFSLICASKWLQTWTSFIRPFDFSGKPVVVPFFFSFFLVFL